MSVRQHTWKTSSGETRQAYLVQYSTADLDIRGKRRRHVKFFKTKAAARAFEAQVRVDVSQGVHVPSSKSITVNAAGKLWLDQCKIDGIEQATIDSYENHFHAHIAPYLGGLKLSALTVATVRDWQNKLLTGVLAPGQNEAEFGEGRGSKKVLRFRSPDTVRRATISLGALLAEAQEQGKVATNVVRSLNANRGKRRKNRSERRSKKRLVIPSPTEIDAILQAAKKISRESNSISKRMIYPLLLVAIRCGLRASELRGLQWSDIELKKGKLHVVRKADKNNEIGPTKSEAGERTIPIPPTTLVALREWKLICPKRDSGRTDAKSEAIKELHYVFPNGEGNIEHHANLQHRLVEPTLIAAGVTTKKHDSTGEIARDESGKPIMIAKYSGLHAFRHYFASWCINRKKDGGQELTPKMVQEFMGHSTITLTMDLYGHLFPRGDNQEELAAAEGKFG